MIEQLLETADASLLAHEAQILLLAEQAKVSVHGGERYGAFPETSSTRPLDTTPVTPDNLTGKFENEPASLDDMGVTTDDFNIVNGVGFQFKEVDGETGFWIEYLLEGAVADQDDLNFLSTIKGTNNASIGDIVILSKKVNYVPISYGSWVWYKEVDLSNPLTQVA